MLGSFAAFVVLMPLLVWRERSTASPLITTRLFAAPAFTMGVAGTALVYALLYGMFFLLSFAMVRGYHLPEIVAGVRLASIPVAIGVVAPFSGALAGRWGSRRIAGCGMALCIAVLVTVSIMAPEQRIRFAVGLTLLGLFGAGIGLFIAPNNEAAMSAAPPELSAQAGAMLNLMRSLGTSIGIAAASSMLTWRMAAAQVEQSGFLIFEGRPLLSGVESSFAMLILFALLAGVLSLARGTSGRERT